MSRAEFERWQEFYLQQPFDDLHRYHRPAALMAVKMGGGKFGEYVDLLVNDSSKPEISDADMNTFAALGMAPPKGWGE
ncbi:MAG: hypothetical protein PHN76_06030 [Advenella sp.]|uniref:hypothetical protein n=1 Tax=Advenella sp. TaxID=1872388 RepID=UPI00258586BE|nr:hypothetical protein [Advenella sp.]MDD3757705.1 hypothetical protein [Advenella sp.]